MKVKRRVFGQRNLAAVNQASGAPQFGIAVQAVFLKEQEDVVLINLNYPEVHCAEVHGAEWKHQVALVGQDIAFKWYLYGREGVRCGETGAEVIGKRQAAFALDSAVNGQGEVLPRLRLEIYAGAVVLDVYGLADGSGQFDEAFARGRCGQRLAEAYVRVGIAVTYYARVYYLE